MSPNNGVYESIDDLEITIDKKTNEKPKFSLFPEKEWLLVKIAEIKKQMPPAAHQDWGPTLNFEFHFQQSDMNGRKIWFNTPVVAIPGNKLYGLYLEVMGLKDKDIQDGAVFSPKSLTGKLCYVMIETHKTKKTTKGDPRQDVVNIKHCELDSSINEASSDISKAASKVESKVQAKVEAKTQAMTENKPTVKKVEQPTQQVGDLNVDEIDWGNMQ